ncbi:unnamed protein product [Rotaria sp. Silwood2]|nr:unnamed protein product [Rotaria sp. Silwood2]
MNDAAPPHKTLYRWEKRQSALDQPSKPTKHDDIKTWLRQVENASSNAVETVFPRSSGRQTGKILANQAATYAKTIDTTHTEARAILDEWMNDKLRLEAGLNDSYDEEIVQSNVRSVKQACNLSFDDDDDNQLEFLREPKDLLTFQDPSVYYETHDETDLVKDILHDLRSKDILTRQQLIAMEKNKSSTVDIQTKIEERHRQVKENHEKMQKERELKRKQLQAKKEAETQARLLVLKEERERALKAKQEEEMIERHVIEIRKEMHEKRLQDEDQRKHQREYENAKLERTKAEQERTRKEEELQKLKGIALKEQQDLNEKRLHTLVDDFIRMKSLTIVQKHFSAWLNVVLERRLRMGRAAALADWKLLFQSFNWWRSMVRTKRLEEETEAHMTEMKIFSMKMQQASLHYERTLLRKSMIIWQIYIRNERIAKNLKYEQETTKKKIDAFLEAASTGKLWENEQQTPLQTATTTNSAATTTRQQSQQIKARKVSITTRASSLISRSRSAVTFGDKSSFPTRTQSDIKLDDFFQTTSPRDEQEESQRALDDDLFKPKSSSKNTDTFSTDWEIVDRHTPTKDFGFSGTNSSSYSNNDTSSSSSKSKTQSSTSYGEGNNSEAQKRFSNAKAISSDQFFNKDSDNQNNVISRFQGSASISSEDFFDDPNKKKQDRSTYQSPDLSGMTADFKEGVSKAANKLSSGSKTVYAVKATPSKEHKGQFNVQISNPISKYINNEYCVIEPDSKTPRNYLIYIVNDESNKKTLFGQLFYEICIYNNCLYTIVIGRKLYKVRSSDLKDRRLAIIDTFEQNNPSKLDQYPTFQCPQILFQVIDTFSKSNKAYHVTINDKEQHLGYLAIVILLDLHECKLD